MRVTSPHRWTSIALSTATICSIETVKLLREADGSSVAEGARKHKISEQTINIWRRKFGALDPADVKRLRSLEAENAFLKRMVGEREMAIETLREINRRKW